MEESENKQIKESITKLFDTRIILDGLGIGHDNYLRKTSNIRK